MSRLEVHKAPTIQIQAASPQLDSLHNLRFMAANPSGIECDIFGTLGSDGKYGLFFDDLAAGVYGVAKAYGFTGEVYDFGFGNGLVLALFAAAGFHAYGRENRSEAFTAAVTLTGCDWALLQTGGRVHLERGNCLEESPKRLAELKVWYLYPSSGMTEKVVALYNAYGADDSVLVMRSNGELDNGYHAHLPSALFHASAKWSMGFCIAAKKADVVERVIREMRYVEQVDARVLRAARELRYRDSVPDAESVKRRSI